MIFEDKSLKSIYELDHVLQEDHDLLSASKEIYRITHLLMDKYQRNEIVKFYHHDNNGDAIYVDFNLVSENTWYRSVAEIKQILYRHTDSSQFSIHKVLYDLGIIEPESTFEYNRYLQIIYVFLSIFLYLLKCPQSLILSALRAFCFCGKPHISRSIFLYFRYQAWLKSW